MSGWKPAAQDEKPACQEGNRPSAYKANEWKTYQRRIRDKKKLQYKECQDGKPAAQDEKPADQEGNRPSAYKGNELKTYQRRSRNNQKLQYDERQDGKPAAQDEKPAGQEGNRPSAYKGKAIAASTFELKTYQRRISDHKKLQSANSYCEVAYLEVMRMAKEASTWVPMKPPLSNLHYIASEFQTSAPPGKKLEFSVATAVIPNISASKMVNMMINVDNDWSKLLFPIVNYGQVYKAECFLQHLANTDTTIKGVAKVQAELQLPTTFVPTRYFDFLRYVKEITNEVYIVVDIDSNYFGHHCSRSNSLKRPSGVIVREHGPQDCEIIWVENVEVDEPRENIYSSITNSNLAFSANHWISTLLRKLRRDRSTFIDVKIDIDRRAGAYLLALTRSMKHFYMECVSEHPEETLLSVLTAPEYPIRILRNKSLEGYIGYVGLTSFRIQAKPLLVFQFLVEKDLQLQFRSFSNSETEEEPEQLFKFVTDDENNTISLHRKKMKEGSRHCLQEASRDEYCSFILSKIMSEHDVNLHIVSGDQSIYEQSKDRLVNIVTSGFAIMPDGPGGLHCNGSLVTFLAQLFYDPKDDLVMHDSAIDDFLVDLNDIKSELNQKVVGKND